MIGLLAGAVVLAALWVAAELRAATPLIDMKMMRRTAVWTNNLVALLIGLGMYATFAFLPEFVQTPSAAGYGFGASITRSGLMLLPSSFTMFAVGMFAGRLARRLGGKVLVIAGCLIGCVAMSILAFAHAETWEIYLSTAIMGVGFGLAFAAMSALVVAAVPASQTGVASGMNANIRTIGGSIGAAVMASIVTSRLGPSGLPEESGYTIGFAVMAGADACMEEIAARAGVGVGTVYRRFASKDALIDELLRLALEEVLSSTDRALARADGYGLEELLRAFGQSFADHARYASLLLQRRTDDATARWIRQAVQRADRTGHRGRHGEPGHYHGRRPGAGLGHARARPGGRRGRPRDLAAFPRHPSRRPAGGGAAQRHAAAVVPAAVEAGTPPLTPEVSGSGNRPGTGGIPRPRGAAAWPAPASRRAAGRSAGRSRSARSR